MAAEDYGVLEDIPMALAKPLADPTVRDLRRDAEELLRTDVAVHILDMANEDIPTEDEIHLLRDIVEEDKWTGIFTVETNAEKIYEVSYNYNTGKFYITTYLMTICKQYDPPHKY